MLIARQYLGPVGRGVTSPQLFRAASGMVYVVKLENNCLGKKVLVNEYLAAKIGSLMGLCFPPSDVIMLESEVLQHQKLRAKHVTAGPHFASLYLDRTSYADRNSVAKAINKQQMAGVILFDHMFHNVDRTHNYRNLLVRREADGPRIYAIDNSHLFFSGRWRADSLYKLAGEIHMNHRRSYGVLLKYFLSPQSFIPYIEAVREMKNSELETIINGIPEKWLTAEARAALLEFLLIRRDKVTAIAAKLISLIPNSYRGPHTN